MVSIQGLPQPISRSNQTSKKTRKAAGPDSAAEPTVVAKAVSRGIRNPELAGEAHNRIQYDLPDGKGRNALSSYLDVLHHARREELAALVGVDVFV